MRIPGIIALGAIAFAVAACGGGGGGGTAGGPTAIVPVNGPSAPIVGATSSPSPTGVLPAGSLVASVSISLPKGSYAAATRRAQTIGANTQSIVFTLLQVGGVPANGAPQTFGLTASSPGCATNTTTLALTCSLGVTAPIGQNDVFLAQTYSGPNGSGTLTGSGAVALSVAQNATNTASISLNAQVASIYLVTSSAYLGPYPYSSSPLASVHRALPAGYRSPQVVAGPTTGSAVNSMRVFVVALDSAGNIILNPSAYDTPITLQLGFFYGSPDFTLQATYAASDPSPCTGGTASASGLYGYLSVCSPSDVVTATVVPGVAGGAQYGLIVGSIGTAPFFPTPAPGVSPSPFPASAPTGASYTAFLVTSHAPGTITLTSQSGTPVTSLEPGTTAYVTESGYSGGFTVTSAGCSGIANVFLNYNNYGFVPGVGYTYYGQIAASGIAPGTCSAAIGDGTTTITVPVTVTTTTVTGS